MRRIVIGLCTLALAAVEAGTASAAWDNVFQTTLFGCWRKRQQTSSSYYAVPAAPVVAYAPPVVAYSPPPCCTPCQQCTTNYVQRCFYQPVTTYQTQTYYEPVTT